MQWPRTVPREAPAQAGLPENIPLKGLCIYVGLALLLIILVSVVGVTTGAGNAAGWAMAPVSMTLVMIVTFMGKRCKCLPAHNAITSLEGNEVSATPSPERTQRMAWMDNAKVVMIILVVMGHSGMAFALGSAGISFVPDSKTCFTPAAFIGLILLKPLVIPLFFFISGFVAPTALDRKGPQTFMKANFRRLGLAYFFCWLFFWRAC